MVVPHTAARAATPTMAFIDTLEGTGEETGGEIWASSTCRSCGARSSRTLSDS